ncbi:MAG: glutaredoxin family protein, partial [Bacteroidota bacterium]
MRLLVLLSVLVAAAGCASDDATTSSSPDGSAQAPAVPVAPAGEATAADSQSEVVLYVTEWCPYCTQAREFMTAQNVPHRVVDIEKDIAGAREYTARGGTGGIPLVAVGDLTMEGWSAARAQAML